VSIADRDASQHQNRFRAKVSAWVHDPLGKALILGTGHGHESGSVRELRRELGLGDIQQVDRVADRFAAGADRIPMPRGMEFLADFRRYPEVRHPLSGVRSRSSMSLLDVKPEVVEATALAALRGLVVRTRRDEVDWYATHLLLWRFGGHPHVRGDDHAELGQAWTILPADTRVPDHTIGQHLDLAAAYAGVHPSPALFAFSIGPVQSFIRVARKTADLWAGSNLLGTLAWEAMSVVAKRYGPDSILLPSVRGVALADLWLVGELGERDGLVGETPAAAFAAKRLRLEDPAWDSRSGDHPLLRTGLLPNRFVALVDARETAQLASEVRVRCEDALAWWMRIAFESEIEEGSPAGFPEIFASWVDLSGDEIATTRDELLKALCGYGGEASIVKEPLRERLQRLGCGGEEGSGRALEVFGPGAGELYPLGFELVERALAGAKSVRAFAQPQLHVDASLTRCDLCGERHAVPRAARGTGEDESLCELCSLKRAWPRLVRRMWDGPTEVAELASAAEEQWVPSTVAMALVPTQRAILQTIERRGDGSVGCPAEALEERAQALAPGIVARVHRVLGAAGADSLLRCFRLAVDKEREGGADELESGLAGLPYLQRIWEEVGGDGSVPATSYYALVRADGDRMGGWLTATAPGVPTNSDRLASTFAKGLLQFLDREVDEPCAGSVREFLAARRGISPAWHGAIAQALNTFGAHSVPWLIEGVLDGKVIFTGGDDLLAMIPIDRVLALLWLLQSLYQGTGLRDPFAGNEIAGERVRQVAVLLGLDSHAAERVARLELGAGWVRLPYGTRRDDLRLAMGERATISVGVTVAHATYPLRAALREVAAAEHAAKGLRSAFSLSVLKRSGGTESVTSRLPSSHGPGALAALAAVSTALGAGMVSRTALQRAAQHLRELPYLGEGLDSRVVAQLVAHESLRGVGETGVGSIAGRPVEELLVEVTRAVLDESAHGQRREQAHQGGAVDGEGRQSLASVLAIAEFLTRGLRAPLPEQHGDGREGELV